MCSSACVEVSEELCVCVCVSVTKVHQLSGICFSFVLQAQPFIKDLYKPGGGGARF